MIGIVKDGLRKTTGRIGSRDSSTFTQRSA